jgi:hypothetical protein
VGLFGALATRYRLIGRSISEVEIWQELAPFLEMSKPDSIEALAEYIVFLERPEDAKLPWLRAAVYGAVTNARTFRQLTDMAIARGVPWVSFLRLTPEELGSNLVSLLFRTIWARQAEDVKTIENHVARVKCDGSRMYLELQCLRTFAVDFGTTQILGMTSKRDAALDEFAALLTKADQEGVTSKHCETYAQRIPVYTSAVRKITPDSTSFIHIGTVFSECSGCGKNFEIAAFGMLEFVAMVKVVREFVNSVSVR